MRRTLLRWLLLPLLALVPAAAALQNWLVLQPTREAFDQSLGGAAISVATFVRVEGGEVQFEMNPQAERALRTDLEDSIYYAVLAPDGRRIAGDPPLATPPLALAADAWRFYDSEIDAAPVRVAETLAKRTAVYRESLIGAVGGVLAFALASAVSILLATRQALKPLQRLSAEVGTRGLADLRPVAAAGTPGEVQGLVDAVNRLIDRVREGSLAQQAFLADAAHQLRTPLAALKNEAELALATPHPAELHTTLQHLEAAASRAARLSSQLLALARSDGAAQASMALAPLDLKALAAEAAQDWVPHALAVGIDLGFELEPAPLQGRHFLLRELLANLLHNAIEYAGRGAHVTVRTRRDGDVSVLEVEDDGPGIAPAERQQVFDRFRRGQAAAGGGSGLGLAVVRDIAAGHGARVSAEDTASGRGVRMRVCFGAATATAGG